MVKRPSWLTLILTFWVGFMFATAVAALFPSLRLLAAPILCRAPYGHGVVQVHDFSYGPTSGYSLSLRCANAAHQEKATSWLAVIGVLWLLGWVGAFVIRQIYYWLKVLVLKPLRAVSDRRFERRAPRRPASMRSHLASGSDSASAISNTPATSAARELARQIRAGGPAVLVGGSLLATSPDSVSQLTRLADLHARGALTDEEFAAEKAKIVGAV